MKITDSNVNKGNTNRNYPMSIAIKRIAKRAFDGKGKIRKLKEQLKEIKIDKNFGMGIIYVGDALRFGDIGGYILFSRKVIDKINKHGISDKKIVSIIENINNNVVLGFDYYDKSDKDSVKRKGFVLEDYDNVLYILGIKISKYNNIEVETLSTFHNKDDIDGFLLNRKFNNLYKNKKSSGFLDRVPFTTGSLSSSTTINNISNKSNIVKSSKQINYNNSVKKTSRITLAAMCLAIGIILPQATHFLPEFANKLSLMHIPTYVAGIICGPLYGLFVGVFSPLLSLLFFNMPRIPSCYSMMIELGAYGLFSGIFYQLIKTKSKVFNIYSSLILSMLIGKIIYGVCNALIFKAGEYTFALWIAAAFINGILGIILHLIIVPSICFFLQKRINYNK